MSWADFDKLAGGGGGADVTRQLWRAQRSRRLVLLRAFIDDIAERPDLYGPLPEPNHAWDLLVRVEEAAPSVLDAVLMHPYSGSWLSRVHNLIRGRITDGDRPLWMEVGYFHALAATAAIRAEIDFDARIPVCDGCAILPTVGMARFATPARWSVAQIRSRGGRVELSTPTDHLVVLRDHQDDTPQWWGLRTLVTRSDGRELSVTLDDLDPYRGLSGPKPAQRVDPDDVRIWQKLLDEAWGLIVRLLPDYAESIPAALQSLVPYPAVAFRNQSGSTSETFGGAILERPPDAGSLAATLVHEFQHIRLYGLLNLIDLHKDDRDQRFYTLWRDDPRPVGGVLHGVYSFFGVTEFWRAMARASHNRRALFEFAYWRAGTWRTLQALRGDPTLTDAGHRFAEGIAERLGPWQRESVPDDIAGLAVSAGLDHHAGWRIRHVRPPAGLVATLAERWLSGQQDAGPLEPAPQELTVEPHNVWPGARTDLVRLHLAAPERGSYAEIAPLVPEATAADMAYLAGTATDAVQGYLAEVRADPHRPASWVGLGLALSASGHDRPARSLLHRPELVRAVYREVLARTAGAAEPVELAAWLSGPDR
jgi:HEXXH motif-containing protein